MSEITESRLQQECFLWHWNTHPDERGRLWMQYNTPKNRAHGAILRGMGMVAGVSDLAYLRADGRPLFIELKVGDGKQSPAQKWWESVVSECGAEYVVVRSLEEFQNLIQYQQQCKTKQAT